MSTNLEPITKAETKKISWIRRAITMKYWKNQNRWLLLLTTMLTTTLVIYLICHSTEQYNSNAPHEYYDEPHEAEFKKMDANDISYITSLINAGSTYIPVADAAAQKNDSVQQETGKSNPNILFKDNPNSRVVKDYIVSQLPYVYPQDTSKVFNLLDEQPNQLAVAFIQNARFRVKSYFWLAGPHTYLEVVFWTIFGVITSILFYISSAIANGIGFRPEESPGHLAKIAYAPFISLIIIFSYNVISNPDSFIDVNASKGTLIVSFLLGFYSSRAMKLLDKIKDVVLPYGDKTSADKDREKDGKTDAAATVATTEVNVDLTINDPNHADQEILQGHISTANVSITPKEGGEEITLEQNSDDELDSTFSAPNVQSGEYTLNATLTTSEGENYEGTEEITISEETNTFELTLTKTEVSG